MSTLAQLKNLLEQSDYEVRSYSGRGMYGKSCLGIVCESPVSCILDILKDGDSNNITDIIELLYQDCRQDNMGLDTIVYFPHIKWDEYEKADYYAEDDEDDSIEYPLNSEQDSDGD